MSHTCTDTHWSKLCNIQLHNSFRHKGRRWFFYVVMQNDMRDKMLAPRKIWRYTLGTSLSSSLEWDTLYPLSHMALRRTPST